MEAIYTATVTSTGGRDGHVKSTDGVIDMDMKRPITMGGKEEGYTNPEQLFAAGYSACYNGALVHVALKRRIRITPSVTAHVSIGNKEEGEGFQLAVVLDVNIPGVDDQTAKELARAADQFCPYSNAIRGNVGVEIKITNND